MTDCTELKRLAEAAGSSGADLSDLHIDTEHIYSAEYSLIRLYEAATPAAVLALIAENERLRLDNSSLRGSCARLGAEHAAMSRNFKKANRMQFEARTERDRLKAENNRQRLDIEAWRLTVDAERANSSAYQGELNRLKGPDFTEELAALRKGSERYEWLRKARSGHIEVVEWIGPHATGMTGEDLDALLDAAMGKGEQS